MSISPATPPPVAFITGGGTGLGLACAKEFRRRGYTVVVTGRRGAVLEEACKAIRSVAAPRAGLEVFSSTMDVRSAEGVTSSVDAAVAMCGGSLPNIVVNNAAGNFISPSERLTPNAWKAIMDIVVHGTINVTMEIGRRWIAAAQTTSVPADSIFVQVGASYAGKAGPFVAASAAAKSATLSLTQSLAVEWGRYGLRTLMVSQGPIYTEGAFSRLDPGGVMSQASDLSATVPLRRQGSPEEYAGFLASLVCQPGASTWLSGAHVHFDGGAAAAGGEFGALQRLTKAEWDAVESQVRSVNSQGKVSRAKL